MTMRGKTLGKTKRRSSSGPKTLLKPQLFKTLAEVRSANKALGRHFFDKDTMRAFKSRIESGLIGGSLFITSEDFGGGRVFQVRRANTVGEVRSVSRGLNTKKEALGIARQFSKEFDARPGLR